MAVDALTDIAEQDAEDCAGAERARASLVSTETAADVARLFKALSDPTRVRIISVLIDHELCVHSIVEVLGMTQSAVSHQLQTLRAQRIVRARRAGKHIYYTLADAHIGTLFKQGRAHVEHD